MEPPLEARVQHSFADSYIVALESGSSNKKLFASAVGRKSGSIEVLDLPQLRPSEQVVGPHSGEAPADIAAFSKSPTSLVSCGADCIVKLWDMRAKGGAPSKLHTGQEPSNAVSVCSDDRLCAFSCGAVLHVFDLVAGKELFTHEDAHFQPVSCLLFNPHRAHELISGGEDGLLCAVDTQQCAKSRSAKDDFGLRLVVNTNDVVRMINVIGDDAAIVATVSSTETLQLWSFHEQRSGTSCGRFEELRSDRRLCVSESEGYVVGVGYDTKTGRARALAGAVDGNLALFHLNMETVAFQAKLPRHETKNAKNRSYHTGIVRSAALFDPARGWDAGFATGGEDGRICVWMPSAGEDCEAARREEQKRRASEGREQKKQRTGSR